MTRGKLILIEGLDRAGKSSQCVELANRLGQGDPSKAVVIRFPDRTTPIGTIINQYLTNTDSASAATLETMHLLFSANRWEVMSRIKGLLQDGVDVVLDRYVYSGIAYSYTASRSASTTANKPLDLAWLAAPDVGLPQPDLTVFLKVSEQVAQARGGFGAERYEKLEFQRVVAKCFDMILPSECVTIDADKTMDEVSDLIYAAVSKIPADLGALTYYSKIV